MSDHNRAIKDVLVIGQAPPEHAVVVPFERTRLYRWLATVGISQCEALERFEFAALVASFPGKKAHGHAAPAQAEIERHRPALVRLIDEMSPKVIVTVGILATRHVLNDHSKMLNDTVGQCFTAKPFGIAGREIPVLPLPHPSGASPWIHLPGNGELLGNALKKLSALLTK